MKTFSIVVAAATSSNFGIGKNGGLPWKIAEDMAFFKSVTMTAPASKLNAVIMGRKTYESIPAKFRPLAGRLNIVLSRDSAIRESLSLPDGVLSAGSLNEAMAILSGAEYSEKVHDVFIIGGASVYEEALTSPSCAKVFLTEVINEIDGLDTFFPRVPADKFRLIKRSKLQQSNEFSFRFAEYESIPNDEIVDGSAPPLPKPTGAAAVNAEEMQYLNIVKDILATGVLRGDRTGTGTLSKFGVQMRFSLRDNVFPLLTTKRVFWRGVAEELIWFVHGSTNGKLLGDKDIHIWDGNGSREFLDSRGLNHREEGDLGPVYGFQVRLGCSYFTIEC
jgi:dihydrofolate reductase / thymidylate synthase